eukprot:1431490-Prymnesium_polylepis.1
MEHRQRSPPTRRPKAAIGEGGLTVRVQRLTAAPRRWAVGRLQRILKHVRPCSRQLRCSWGARWPSRGLLAFARGPQN